MEIVCAISYRLGILGYPYSIFSIIKKTPSTGTAVFENYDGGTGLRFQPQYVVR